MSVWRQSFKSTLPGKLCQSRDFFDTGIIHYNLSPRSNVGENFGIAWSRVQNYACFHYLNHLEALLNAIFQQIFELSRPFRQIGRIVNKN